jgi:enolase
MLKRKRLPVGVGDEGGYAVPFAKNEEALKTLLLAARTSGYIPGKDVFLAMDVAASEFFKGRKYHLSREGKKVVREDMVKWYKSLVKKYPLVSIEDPLHEDDWAGWVKATHELDSMLVVGDDFFVTNTERLRRGIDMGAANAILIKPNQIGTLTETMAAIGLAKANGYKVIISHRSGETGDTTIADLAVAVNADFIKTGSLSRGERVVKYNRLMEIEEELAAR